MDKTNKRTGKPANEWTNEEVNGQTSKRMGKRAKEWVNEQMNGQTNRDMMSKETEMSKRTGKTSKLGAKEANVG